jgi:hypothetical protein
MESKHRLSGGCAGTTAMLLQKKQRPRKQSGSELVPTLRVVVVAAVRMGTLLVTAALILWEFGQTTQQQSWVHRENSRLGSQWMRQKKKKESSSEHRDSCWSPQCSLTTIAITDRHQQEQKSRVMPRKHSRPPTKTQHQVAVVAAAAICYRC